MLSPELNGGLPRLWIEPTDNKDALQTRYGNFAVATLKDMIDKEPDFPEDILVFGDNWFQLSVLRDQPKNGPEQSLAKLNPTTFADMWQIMERDEATTIPELLLDLRAGVEARTLDERIQDKIAVLDLTSIGFPIIDESQIIKLEDYPWGRVIQMRGFTTRIYHITEGYNRKTALDLSGKPGDDASITIFVDKK